MFSGARVYSTNAWWRVLYGLVKEVEPFFERKEKVKEL